MREEKSLLPGQQTRGIIYLGQLAEPDHRPGHSYRGLFSKLLGTVNACVTIRPLRLRRRFIATMMLFRRRPDIFMSTATRRHDGGEKRGRKQDMRPRPNLADVFHQSIILYYP